MTKRLAVLLALIVILAGCAPSLPEEEEELTFAVGYEAGYSWGYFLPLEDEHYPIFWTAPNKVDEVQKFHSEQLHSEVNIRDFYIPKGYWTMEDVANAHFPDGTPYNEKQKKQAVEAYNWGFYAGFHQGFEDWADGKPPHHLR